VSRLHGVCERVLRAARRCPSWSDCAWRIIDLTLFHFEVRHIAEGCKRCGKSTAVSIACVESKALLPRVRLRDCELRTHSLPSRGYQMQLSHVDACALQLRCAMSWLMHSSWSAQRLGRPVHCGRKLMHGRSAGVADHSTCHEAASCKRTRFAVWEQVACCMPGTSECPSHMWRMHV
jgi:hypothetical protein